MVRPGENIPVDGIVIEGTSAVNEAALTGESIPVDKKGGDAVSAATLNQSGFIRCEATRVGEDTTLSQIIQMVSDAAATKAPIAKVADRVSGVFYSPHFRRLDRTYPLLCGKIGRLEIFFGFTACSPFRITKCVHSEMDKRHEFSIHKINLCL